MTNELAYFENIVRKASELSAGQDAKEPHPHPHPFDERNIHPDIGVVSKKLFDDGHYSQATFEALKHLDQEVRRLSALSESGLKLMMAAFSEANPKIKLNNLVTTSETDEQMGYKFIFSGVMSGIRNPRGHEILTDSIDLCLDNLSIASSLLRKLEARPAP